MTQKTSSSFTVCHNFALEINYFPVLLSVRALLARLPKRNKRKVVSGSRVTLPENFACKPGLSFDPLARVTLAVGLPYLLVNRALILVAAFPLRSVCVPFGFPQESAFPLLICITVESTTSPIVKT